MICHSQDAETSGILHIAQRMCVAARTAPKARGVDHIDSCYLTGDEKEALAAEMDRLGREQDLAFFIRDAENVRNSTAVVLVGTSISQRGLNEACQYCNHQSCAECAREMASAPLIPWILALPLVLLWAWHRRPMWTTVSCFLWVRRPFLWDIWIKK